ncbi:MAG: NepR family anti-sigma factor [Dehalococcoidia bacterium]
MRSATECREQAEDWRALANRCYGDRRHHALDMAEHWEDLARQVDSANNHHLAGMLKAVYDDVADEPVPDRFRELLGQLDAADARSR